VKNRELEVKLLWLRIFESFVGLVPSSTFKIKTMDINTFVWRLELFAFNSTIVTLNGILEHI
jgi:hypothetical protein